MSDFHLKINFKDAPPEVQAWYVAEMEKAEVAESMRLAKEAEERVDGPVRRDGFAPAHLTREDGTVYRPDPVIAGSHDKRYREHVSQAIQKLSGEVNNG